MALLATSIAACSSPTLPDVPSLALWALGKQIDPTRCGSKYALCPPTHWGISTRTRSGSIVAAATHGLVAAVPATSAINLLARKLRRSLLRELPAEAPNDLLVPLAKDLSAGTTALSSLIEAILGSPLSQLSFLRAR